MESYLAQGIVPATSGSMPTAPGHPEGEGGLNAVPRVGPPRGRATTREQRQLRRSGHPASRGYSSAAAGSRRLLPG